MDRYAYQPILTNRIMDGLAEPRRSILLQLPTGGGKTRIASEVVRRFLARGLTVWFICHREEILQQTSDELEAAGIPHGFLAAGRKADHQREVYVCSVQSLPRRLAAMPPPDVIIWDECQHARAESWQRIKEFFSDAHHLGLSATPCRLDGKGFGDLFDEMICGPSTRELIALGALSPFRLFGPTIPDLRGIKTRRGDYEVSGLEEAMNKPVLVGDVVDHYKRLAPGARAIAFACSVKASIAVVDRFNEAGIPARHVDGTTPGEERKAALKALGAGEIKVLSNVEVFTEGLNIPAIDAVILLRPTKSLGLYRQMVGRGLRPAPGKGATVILDHAGLVHEHGLPDDEIMWTLDGHSHSAESGEDGEGRPRIRRCPACSAIHAWAAECVECGHIYVPEDRSIEEVFGELQELHSLSKNYHPRNYPMGTFEKRADFARRVGRSKNRITKWVARGLPCGPNGWIAVEAGLAWVAETEQSRSSHTREKDVSTAKPFEPASPIKPRFQGETYAEFQARTGITAGKDAMRRAGLPTWSDGTVNSLQADEWLKTAQLSKKSMFATHEPIATFCRRIGQWPRGHSREKVIALGIPTENGMVPIKEGLEWAFRNGLVKGEPVTQTLCHNVH